MVPDGMEGQGWGRFMMVEEKKVLNRLNMDSVSSDERIKNCTKQAKTIGYGGTNVTISFPFPNHQGSITKQ